MFERIRNLRKLIREGLDLNEVVIRGHFIEAHFKKKEEKTREQKIDEIIDLLMNR